MKRNLTDFNSKLENEIKKRKKNKGDEKKDENKDDENKKENKDDENKKEFDKKYEKKEEKKIENEQEEKKIEEKKDIEEINVEQFFKKLSSLKLKKDNFFNLCESEVIYQFKVYNCLKSINFDEIIQNKENEEKNILKEKQISEEKQKKDFFFNLPKLSTNDYSERFKVYDNLIYLILTDKIMFFYKKIFNIIKNINDNNHGQYIQGTYFF
jgi:hypothetical protein